jgi:hypothetical protein
MMPITLKRLLWIVRASAIATVVLTISIATLGTCSDVGWFADVLRASIWTLPFTVPFLWTLRRSERRLSWYLGVVVFWVPLAILFAIGRFDLGLDLPKRFLGQISWIWFGAAVAPLIGLTAAVRYSRLANSELKIFEGVTSALAYAMVIGLLWFATPNFLHSRKAANEASAVGQLRLIRECFTSGDDEKCASKIKNPSWGYRFYLRSNQGHFEDAQARPTRFECSGISSFLIDANGKIHRTAADREATASDQLLSVPQR